MPYLNRMITIEESFSLHLKCYQTQMIIWESHSQHFSEQIIPISIEKYGNVDVCPMLLVFKVSKIVITKIGQG